jgi:small subunit ribosomal protein S20
MPNTKSAKKRLRREQRRRTFNRRTKSIVKTALTKARQTVATSVTNEEDEQTRTAAVRSAISALDRAARKGVIHKNNAARRKSRLMKLVNASAAPRR